MDVLVAVEPGQALADKVFQIAFFQDGPAGNDSVLDVSNLIGDIFLQVLIENGIVKRVPALQKHLLEDLIEVEGEGHAHDAFC